MARPSIYISDAERREFRRTYQREWARRKRGITRPRGRYLTKADRAEQQQNHDRP